MVKDTDPFLKELHRITKPGGTLYLEDGHQPRTLAKEKVLKSGCWVISRETKNFMQCTTKTY
jgi:ubiquinone/menaquinone biosynthesis C-methylase UbiE